MNYLIVHSSSLKDQVTKDQPIPSVGNLHDWNLSMEAQYYQVCIDSRTNYTAIEPRPKAIAEPQTVQVINFQVSHAASLDECSYFNIDHQANVGITCCALLMSVKEVHLPSKMSKWLSFAHLFNNRN